MRFRYGRPGPFRRRTAALVAVVGLSVALAACHRDAAPYASSPSTATSGSTAVALAVGTPGHTTVTLAVTGPAGGRAPNDDVTAAEGRLRQRFADAGIRVQSLAGSGPDDLVAVLDADLTAAELERFIVPGALTFRVVLNTAPDTTTAVAEPSPTGTGTGTGTGSGAAPGIGDGRPAPADDQPTLAEVRAKLGALYDLAAASTDPTAVAAPTLARFAPFGLLSPAEVAVLPAAIQFGVPTIGCDQLDGRPVGDASVDVLDSPFVACDHEGGTAVKLLLDAAKVTGADVAGATAATDPTSGATVTITFTGVGQVDWTALTKQASDEQVINGAPGQIAIVLDTRVLSAPSIMATIPGPAVVSGLDATAAAAFAMQIGHGALPVQLSIESMAAEPR